MKNDPIIYVVDDDRDSRESAETLLRQMHLNVKTFDSAESFLESYDGYRPACLLSDHRMLGMTGIELQEKLRSNGCSLSVIVMTAYAKTELIIRAIKGGAITLLEKPFTDAALWEAIRTALAEDRQHTEAEEKTGLITQRLDALTSSELDVVKLIIKGEPNKAVARQLGVSVRTIENRRSSIFEKMHISSVAELVHLVMIARPELA